MEHVEVLRAMLVDEYPEGSDDGSPTFALERAALTAAIESLSAPAEAQPVAWQFQDRKGNWHEFTDERHRLNTIEDGSWPIRALYAHPPPSAPVGVEGLPERWRREAPQAKVDSGGDAARAYREAVYWCAFQLEAALAQQPATGVGEEIMVNAAHDVFILPLQPSGLSSGPRYVVHVPGQPASPQRRPYNTSGSLSEYGILPECDAAPAAQQQGGAE